MGNFSTTNAAAATTLHRLMVAAVPIGARVRFRELRCLRRHGARTGTIVGKCTSREWLAGKTPWPPPQGTLDQGEEQRLYLDWLMPIVKIDPCDRWPEGAYMPVDPTLFHVMSGAAR
jgi:hypothetical protein